MQRIVAATDAAIASGADQQQMREYFMISSPVHRRKLPWLSAAAVAVALFGTASLQAATPITPKDVVYQIITDRFVDGDPSNNTPSGFDSTLFDDPDLDGHGNGDDLKLYQG